MSGTLIGLSLNNLLLNYGEGSDSEINDPKSGPYPFDKLHEKLNKFNPENVYVTIDNANADPPV